MSILAEIVATAPGSGAERRATSFAPAFGDVLENLARIAASCRSRISGFD
jgi:hypothetical protein